MFRLFREVLRRIKILLLIYILYFLLGLIVVIIGAVPLGTTNIAVMNTTIKEDANTAMKIAYTAGISETILVVVSILFNTQVKDFVTSQVWLQHLLTMIIFTAGIILFFKKNKSETSAEFLSKKSFGVSKELLGFLLGLLNPPVLIYWILVISFLNGKNILLNTSTDLYLLILFLLAVYLGKIITLFGYTKFSGLLQRKMNNVSNTINKIIGSLLLIVSLFQVVKLYIS